ncbi:hypothetical protein BJX64DRAFT_174569 [Aspergillus heterothallicus]
MTMNHDSQMPNPPPHHATGPVPRTEHPETIFIPWAPLDQLLPETDNDSTSTQEHDESSNTSLGLGLAPCPSSSLTSSSSAEPLQIDPVNLMSLSQTFHILPTPEDGDDLQQTADKLHQLAEVVKQGNSLALWTGMKLAPQSLQDAESIVKAQMTVYEREVYEAWKEWSVTSRGEGEPSTTAAAAAPSSATTDAGDASLSDRVSGSPRPRGFQLPDFDWQANVTPIPQGAQSLKKFTQRAVAMDIVFGHQGATPENAAWLTFNMVPFLPIIKAVTKISNMERHFQENRIKSKNASAQGLSDVEAAEIETARRIVAAAERNVNRELERLRRMTRELNRSIAVLRARMRQLEKKGSEG